MAIKTINDKGFSGIIKRQCKGNTVKPPYTFKNGSVVYVYPRANVVRLADGFLIVFTGPNRQGAFSCASSYTDPAQTALDSFVKFCKNGGL